MVDGASPWRRFRKITLPMLAPTTTFLLIMMAIISLQTFDQVFVLTGGGPANSTSTDRFVDPATAAAFRLIFIRNRSLAKVFAGRSPDRVWPGGRPPETVALVNQLMAVSLLFVVQAVLDLRQLWLLFVLTVVGAALAAVDGPARRTFIPRFT